MKPLSVDITDTPEAKSAATVEAMSSSGSGIREKVQDLSDLSSAAKKRRAIAGCKKPDVRKYAGMGSESKCTERVMQGNLDTVIEALEYGI